MLAPHTTTPHPEPLSEVVSPALRSWGRQPAAALLEAFSAAPGTTTLEALDGDPVCLGLGLAGRWSDRDAWLRSRAVRDGFLWNGKSFRVATPDTGWGFNRFGSGSMLGGIGFDLGIGPSYVDGRPAVRIDYARHPRCPWWHRRVLDELREVEPGIFIGPVGFRGRRRVHVLAWFGVDTTRGVRGEAI